ncbi:MAG: twin-arginine translocase subunit TatC [Planctomycetaceae bacterium]|nr:twin-arginine translocase subunit TatC [Planctomycetaceae bacterium]
MTFGEHLEVLRVHLIKAILGLVLATCVTLMFGDQLIRVINEPITAALHEQGLQGAAINDDITGFDFWEWSQIQLGMKEAPPPPEPEAVIGRDELTVRVLPSQLAAALRANESDGAEELQPVENEEPVALTLKSPLFAEWREAAERTLRPVTLNVQEGFMTYLKVSLVAGFVLASPWIFYQIWLFVAAGLYPHERKYVHFYLPVALVLFLGGAFFCFYVVLPFVLDFLLGYNTKLGIVPQIRLSEWISFALLLPVMFGLSFELPVVMLLLERIQIVDVATYREKRRMAILVIAILSMLLTPADPMSMMAMMVPLVLLYELGIWMCRLSPVNASPFGEAA